MKRSDKITKHLSKLQDKLESGKLSPKKIGKVRKNLESWMGTLEAMARDIDTAYPASKQPTVAEGASPIGHAPKPGQHG